MTTSQASRRKTPPGEGHTKTNQGCVLLYEKEGKDTRVWRRRSAHGLQSSVPDLAGRVCGKGGRTLHAVHERSSPWTSEESAEREAPSMPRRHAAERPTTALWAELRRS